MGRDQSRLLLGSVTLIAGIATAGSLWFSLGLGLVPCDLCWYQRVLMYPLVIVLGVAAIESQAAVWRTAIPFSVFGGVIAAYHSILQATSTTCSLNGPCTAVQWQAPVLGFTIPNLSLLAFGLITGVLLACTKLVEGDSESTDSTTTHVE